MFPLMKQHFLINSSISHLFIALLVAGAYLVGFPPTFLFAVTIFSMPVILFFYDDKNNVNRFVISLPVAKRTIIRSRYLFMVVMILIILFYQWIVMILFSSFSDNFRYFYNWQDIVVLFCIGCLITAISIPIYYAVRSFALATGIVGVLWCLGNFFILFPIINILAMEDVIIFNDMDAGFVLLVEKYIPIQPYVILIAISLIIFYSAMKISEQLLSKTDRHS